ncbi:MAG: glycosyltransferase, partial [Candidatus Gottesmanbacteria bacterium]|nr:glycosyltransferase [Candidatus Gottesmanbacteria bacterium]
RITYFAHNVIDDISFLSGHLNLTDNPMLIDCINLVIRIHARLIARLSDRMVVLDEALERRLNRLLSPLAQQKVVFIPMPIARRNSRYTKTRAKELLGIPSHTKVLLSFGFISSYKGTDWLINAFNAAGAKTRGLKLIIAGGPAHSLKDRSRYQQYYETVEKRAAENTDILITGYVPENKISLYFQAADLVVLPYRGIMGASGAFSHALAYRKPTVLSNTMKELTANKDFQNGLKRARVHMSTVFFPMDIHGMIQILNTVKSAKKLCRLARFTSLLTKARDIVKLTMSTYNELYRQTLQHVSTEQSFQIIRSFLGLSSS